jgi:hypothetical protein
MSANHPFVAKSQDAGPFGVGRVVAFGQPLYGTPDPNVFGTGEMAPEEFGHLTVCEVL